MVLLKTGVDFLEEAVGVGSALGGSEPPSRGKLVGAGQQEEEEEEEEAG